MSNFETQCAQMPALFSELMACPDYPMQARSEWRGMKAIYVFFENGKAAHVGRTRNLQQRVRGHLANSHYSASFAFAETRRTLQIAVTYRKGEGRSVLLERADFREEFDRQRGRIGEMAIKFLSIDNPVTQYLFELYAAMQLGTSLDEFETS